MNAKLEHVAIIAKNPLKTAQWFNTYFGFTYFEGDALNENMLHTRTVIKNKEGDMLEIFNHGEDLGEYNGAIKHLCFITNDLDAYYNKFIEDKQIPTDCKIIDYNNSRLFFVTTFDNVSIELIQRG